MLGRRTSVHAIYAARKMPPRAAVIALKCRLPQSRLALASCSRLSTANADDVTAISDAVIFAIAAEAACGFGWLDCSIMLRRMMLFMPPLQPGVADVWPDDGHRALYNAALPPRAFGEARLGARFCAAIVMPAPCPAIAEHRRLSSISVAARRRYGVDASRPVRSGHYRLMPEIQAIRLATPPMPARRASLGRRFARLGVTSVDG